MKKLFPLILLFIILVGSVIAFRMYNKPHRNPAAETSIKTSAIDLFHHFETNETEANTLYLDKVVEVSGKVTEITANQESFPIVVLDSGNPMFAVRCTMEDKKATANVGDEVIIKGICTGYLSDVIVVNGILIK